MASATASADQNAAHFLINSVQESDVVGGGIDNNSVTFEQQQQLSSKTEETLVYADQQNTQTLSTREDGEVVQSEEPVIDIVINNVVCSFNTRCHLNLKKIAMEGVNVEYKRQNGMLNMKLRRPYTTASIWSSGKITCTGATSEEESRTAARRFARMLQRLGFSVKFCNFRVVNVLATCSLPFGIKIANFSRNHPQNASYEPELHPGVTYKLKSPKATLKIFSTGSITVTAPCVANVQIAIEHIYPLVYEYKSLELLGDRGFQATFVKKRRHHGGKMPISYEDGENFFDDDEEEYSDSDETFDTDESQD